MLEEVRTYKRREQFADAFYVSHAWRQCREAYKAKVIYCEHCAKRGLTVPGEQVHHKVRITPENLHDPAITLNWDNLELLCERCHHEEHNKKRWRADGAGHVDLPPI